MVVEILLTLGRVALIDEYDDDAFVRSHNWCAAYHKDTKSYTAQTNIGNFGHKRTISLHRFILDAKPGEEVDHINHNTLDNRRCNLRLCTGGQNAANKLIPSNNSSGLKGVRLERRTGHWEARIRVDGQRLALGTYPTAQDAADAYDKAAIEHFGGFVLTNKKLSAAPNPRLIELAASMPVRKYKPKKHKTLR